MKLKSKVISAILTSSMILTFAGCNNAENTPPDISNAQPSVTEDTSTIFDDFDKMKDWKTGVASIDMSFKIDETSIDMILDVKSTEDGSLAYLNLDTLNLKLPPDMTPTADTSDLKFEDIEIYVSGDKIYIDMDMMYKIIKMSDPTMDIETVKTEFKKQFGDVKFMYVEIDQATDDITTSFTSSLPEDVTIDEITKWFEETGAPVLEKSFEDIRSDFITTGKIHKFFVNNDNLTKLATKLDTMIEDGTLKSLMTSFKALSESADPMTDEEYTEVIGDFKTDLVEFIESLRSDNTFNFELESKIDDTKAILSLSGDADMTSTVTLGDEETTEKVAFEFDIDFTIENAYAKLTLPDKSECISSDTFSNSGNSGSTDDPFNNNIGSFDESDSSHDHTGNYEDIDDNVNNSDSEQADSDPGSSDATTDNTIFKLNTWNTITTYNPAADDDQNIDIQITGIRRGDLAKEYVDIHNRNNESFSQIDYSEMNDYTELVVVEYELRLPEDWKESDFGVNVPYITFNVCSPEFNSIYNNNMSLITSCFDIDIPGARDVYNEGYFHAGDTIEKLAFVTTMYKDIPNGEYYIEISNYPTYWYVATE